MGLLVEGKWVDQWYDTKKTGGRFVRQESSFRDYIGSKNFPAEKNRYHLYVSHACPWAHRVLIFRKLKGLESVLPIIVVDPFMEKNGWEFKENDDAVNNKSFLYEIYQLANPNYTGRVTVPVLWDSKNKVIINNESSEIIRMLNKEFNHVTGNNLDFYPKALREQIDEINGFIYGSINNGVYKVGFSTSQAVYEEEVKKLFDALDKIEELLTNKEYLVANQLTEADIRLFTTLIRFDPVYVGHFKCNIRRIADYPNLSNYVKKIYYIEGVKETIYMEHIKRHYYESHTTINPTGIVPLGPEDVLL